MGRLSQSAGIAPLYGSGFTPSGQPYLLMPFYENGSLQDRLKQQGPMAPEAVRSAGVVIAAAVQTAHENGVLHRDIKPANILVKRSGQPDVADFGIAHLTDDALGASQALTMTPLYTAPEVFDGVESGAASDVYSIGATLYALARGYPAYSDPDGTTQVLALLRRIKEDPLEPLPASVPAGLAAVIAKAMSKSVQDRYATAGDLARALDAAAMEPPKQHRRSRALLLAGIAAVVLAIVLATLAWVSLRPNPTTTDTAETTPTPTPVEQRPTPTPIALAPPATAVPPTPVVEPVTFDLAAARSQARQALVRVEAFSCGGAHIATGVVFGDGVVATGAEVLDSPWWVEVISGGQSYQAEPQTLASVEDFGFIQLDASAGPEPLQVGSISAGDEVAVVGIDGRASLAIVGEQDADRGAHALTLNSPDDTSGIDLGDVVLTSDGSLAGLIAVSEGAITVIQPDELASGDLSAPLPSCTSGSRDLGSGESESAVAPAIAELLALQQLSDAYAAERWPLVRILEPATISFTDATFAGGWRALRQGFVYPLERTATDGGDSEWRIGLIGHETWGNVDITTVLCLTWQIDPVSGSIVQTRRDTVTVHGVEDLATQLRGTIDPSSFRTVVSQNCATA